MSRRRAALVGAWLLAALAPPASAALSSDGGAGASIYLRGALASGAPLQGTRGDGGVATRGAEAACVSCHQRSGLGTVEGGVLVPPITGDYLFRPRLHEAGGPAVPFAEGAHGDREPYDAASLARAIRDGVDPQGRPLAQLMPRFALGDGDMAALIAYLRGLGARQVPGVTDTVLHFATVVTPDADPERRRGTLDVLEHYVRQKNLAPLKPSPPMVTSGHTQYAKSMYMANRHWELHVWELSGPPGTWRAQLERHLAEEPVYALLSGVGGTDWEPVHRFCEDHAIPCLWPNVEVPVVAEEDFYPLYFSKGVFLEAGLVARALAGADGQAAPGVVEQVYRAGDSGAKASQALAAALAGSGVEVRRTAIEAGASREALAEILRGLVARPHPRGWALVLWLRAADLAALGAPPPGLTAVYLSGLMGGLEQSPLPAAWRAVAHMAYPFDLPQRRGVRLDYPLGWFAFRHIPVVDEQAQADAYLACSLLADVLNHMADNFARPYLVEQLQARLDHRLITGYYPHLSLATNQRFASKGGYLVRFRDDAGPALEAEGDWTVP